ncbi:MULTISPECIES: carbohydrate ABC transporter permease [Virgibacillus]|uniref:L-arabinose transport system permease protein AraQ n=2 Tax=Virgibacillus TaxID=84406 RepID=A0A024Q7H4_9BACI|nr:MULTISPECIES: carbohydrate ABC transporter permease [Virgibacillus]EQB38069.1 arabinose transporter permease [Virgibacillus sp. CM-4]MYL40786.1 ABC transporter permease subunit [Virgibacillus massiliensis]GGJ51827.1 L-arabinose transport system permease protein AraQ [Virgibacillus kapii]CDQ38419.1 L-arabinose transport system permease protein AraQ [Virgibacillus massiliensis]
MSKQNHAIVKWIVNIGFIIFALIALFPIISLVISSFMPSSELMRNGISFNITMEKLQLDNYTYIFSQAPEYWAWYGNSLIISVVTIVLSLFFSSMVGYALALYNFKGRNFFFILVLFILMVPFEILMLPLFQLMINTQLVDTYFAVILPMVVAPVAVFFFRQYALGLPKELMDAARIDGTTEYGIFFKIMLPLMGPSLAAMAILQGLSSWNNFLWPLLVLRSNDMFTLPIGLATLLTPYGNNYDVLIAGSVMTIIPIIILFIFFQRYFVSGLTVGGVKG